MGTSEPAEIVEIVQNPVIPPKRQHRNVETKRKLVEATLVPGASVARVARTNGVNTNQLFTWRRLYLAGRLGEAQGSTKLLPVTLQPATSAASSGESGTIHIKLARAQIRIEGRADVGLLRTVLKLLRA
jgi:transposase